MNSPVRWSWETRDYPETDCEFTTVTVDSYGVARDITEFLVGDGHRRIAYVGGNAEDYTNGQLRLKGYRDAMKAAGLEIPDSYIYQGNFSTEAGVEGMKKIYENSRDLPTAVITGSDIIAIGVIPVSQIFEYPGARGYFRVRRR